MVTKLLGRPVADTIELAIKQEIKKRGKAPIFHCLLVGDDPASKLYISRKEAVAEQLGIEFHLDELPGETKPHKIAAKIEELNHATDGFIVQLPLPKVLRDYTTPLLNRVHENKDADGLTKAHRARVLAGDTTAFLPTPIAAVLYLLASTDESIDYVQSLPFHQQQASKLVPRCFKQRKAVIVSNGEIFAQTLATLFLQNEVAATVVTGEAAKTSSLLREADLVVSAVGQPGVVTGDMLKDGATIIDVGTTLVNGKTKGDLNWQSAQDRNIIATPVPGGVGPVTVAMLYANLLALTNET